MGETIPVRPFVGQLINGRSAEDVRDQFQRLGREDPEAGHSVEDEMLRHALLAIRDGHPSPRQLADAVLTVSGADFPRWRA